MEGLAQQAVRDGRPGDALPLFREAYELNLELDDRWRMALVACKLATALLALGQPEGATQVLASGKAQLEEMGADPVWRREIAEWQGHRDGGKLILETYSHVNPVHSQRMAQLLTDGAPANMVSIKAGAA